jgi:hypothetical protein
VRGTLPPNEKMRDVELAHRLGSAGLPSGKRCAALNTRVSCHKGVPKKNYCQPRILDHAFSPCGSSSGVVR